MKDLIVVVADSYQEKVMEGLLPRLPLSSGTAVFAFDIIRNPGHDSGSYNDSHELLRPFMNQYRYAVVIFDFEGCGAEHLKTKKEIEQEVQGLLNNNGWDNRNAIVVIEPEVENWMWIDNIHVEQAIGWEKPESLYNWARNEGLIAGSANKPTRPKETLEAALRISETPKSTAIYKKIASLVSYKRCEDPSFNQLIRQLTDWFPLV
jgi:hypothetical protein